MTKSNDEQNGYDTALIRSNTSVERMIRFTEWERRGRGWDSCLNPVPLEPPFENLTKPVTKNVVIDDARRPSLVQSLFSKVQRKPQPHIESSNSLSHQSLSQTSKAEISEAATANTADESLVELQLFLPQDCSVSSDVAVRLLLSLSPCRFPISFETIGTHTTVTVQFVCRKTDAPHVIEQLQAHFPECFVSEAQDFLKGIWQSNQSNSAVVEFGLAHPFYLPLRLSSNFSPDPLISFIGCLSELKTNEIGVVQILFQKAKYPWSETILKTITQLDTKSLSRGTEMLSLIKQKLASPLFPTIIRFAAQNDSSIAEARRIVRRLGGALDQFTNPMSNQLIPLAGNNDDGEGNENSQSSVYETDVITRQSHRSGMLLSCLELSSLAHPPSDSVYSAKLARQFRRTKAAPDIVIGHKLVLGENTHRGVTKRVSLSPQHRARHMFMLGKSGTGKSTEIINIVMQDITNNVGVCVFDPHGDLVDKILDRIPEDRHKDVVLFDPSDESYPISFNVICANSDLERTLLESDMVATFKRFTTSFGDQMAAVLGNAIQAFLLSERGGTLLDLKRFLVEPRFRKEFLNTVKDEDVVYYFEREFPLLSGNPQGPILTRLNIFLRQRLIRNIVAQKENKLDFRVIMDEGKIFLAKLSQGLIGQENAFLLGTLLVSKFYQTALSRQDVDESQRAECQIVVDELQNFVPLPSLSSALAQTRKYNVAVAAATQDFKVLWNRDSDIASAFLTNACTRICFGLGDYDAEKLADGFSSFNQSDLQNLGVGEAIVRVERNEYDFNLKTFPLPEVDEQTAREQREKIMALSREKYARKREDVERELAEQRQAMAESVASQSLKGRTKRIKSESAQQLPTYPVQQTTVIHPIVIKQEDVSVAPSTVSDLQIHESPLKEKPQLGHGDGQHRYLQNLIKRIAESKGYKATIEQPVLGGTGKVDVSLEREDMKIACEISVTTPGEYELGNIQKCLAAGYKPVVVISANEKHLSNIQQRAQAALSPSDFTNIVFLQPDSFYAYLASLTPTSHESADRVKGYKVNVAYNEANETETRLRSQALAEIISNAKKRHNR